MRVKRSDIEFRKCMKDDLILRKCYARYGNLLDYLKEKTFHTNTLPEINVQGQGVEVQLEGISFDFAKDVIMPWVYNWNDTQRGEERHVVSLPHITLRVPGNLVSLWVPLTISEFVTIQQFYE